MRLSEIRKPPGVLRDGPMRLDRLWRKEDVRRGRMKRLRNVGIWFLLILSALVGVATVRPAFWRNILYGGMFGACRDGSITGVRIWMLLGAGPGGAADYEAGEGYNGVEFASYVDVAVSNNDARLLRLLLSRGALADSGGGNGSMLIASAIHEHNRETLLMLLNEEADPRYSDGWTAVDHARSLGYLDLVPVIEPYLERGEKR